MSSISEEATRLRKTITLIVDGAEARENALRAEFEERTARLHRNAERAEDARSIAEDALAGARGEIATLRAEVSQLRESARPVAPEFAAALLSKRAKKVRR